MTRVGVEREVRTLLTGGAFFEGPRWHDGRWWVSDMHQRIVRAVDPHGGVEDVLRVERRPSGLGWLPDGSLLVVSMEDRKLLRRAVDGSVTVHADLDRLFPGNANDLVVDGSGRAYVGNFGFDYQREEPRETVIACVEPDGAARVAADGLLFPNGMAIADEGRTLVVGETYGSRYTAFAIGDDGSLSERRTWARLDGFFPDGCCLDADGRIWSADARSSRCALVTPGGEIVDEVHVPNGQRCFACMLGGEDGRELLLCGAPESGAAREGKTDAALYVTTVDVPHGGLP